MVCDVFDSLIIRCTRDHGATESHGRKSLRLICSFGCLFDLLSWLGREHQTARRSLTFVVNLPLVPWGRSANTGRIRRLWWHLDGGCLVDNSQLSIGTPHGHLYSITPLSLFWIAVDALVSEFWGVSSDLFLHHVKWSMYQWPIWEVTFKKYVTFLNYEFLEYDQDFPALLHWQISEACIPLKYFH